MKMKNVPSLSEFGIPSQETQPHMPGRHTAEPTTNNPIDMAKAIKARFMNLSFQLLLGRAMQNVGSRADS
jgi:hypothetical protein